MWSRYFTCKLLLTEVTVNAIPTVLIRNVAILLLNYSIFFSACKVNRRHYHTTASPAIEKAAERLEQSIMREALTSLRRLWRFQNHQNCRQNYLSTPSSQQNSSTSKLLTQFADDIASQVMKEVCSFSPFKLGGIFRNRVCEPINSPSPVK